MKPELTCQVARTLDVVGEKWSLLIVRNALRGQTRFSEFRTSLGAPTDILTARLATLVAAGILERRSYREPGSRERFSYHLTPAGEGLRIVMAAMIAWNDEFAPASTGPARRLVSEKGPVRLAYLDGNGREVPRDDVLITPEELEGVLVTLRGG